MGYLSNGNKAERRDLELNPNIIFAGEQVSVSTGIWRKSPNRVYNVPYVRADSIVTVNWALLTYKVKALIGKASSWLPQ